MSLYIVTSLIFLSFLTLGEERMCIVFLFLGGVGGLPLSFCGGDAVLVVESYCHVIWAHLFFVN